LLVAAVAAAMVVAACSHGKTTASPPPPTSAPATTATTVAPTTTTIDPKQQVIAAYENYWKQYTRVSGDPNGRPDDPILLSTVTPQFAKQMELNLFGLRQLHRYTKGAFLVHAQQVDLQGSTASLVSCNRDDTDQYDQNGKDVSGHPGIGTPMQAKASLVRATGGEWLVDQNFLTGASCRS
jgi:hypothetical protein